ALRGQNPFGQALYVSGGSRQKTLSDAWRCVGVGRSTRQQKRAEVRVLYARSHRGTPATAHVAAAITHADSKDRVIGRATARCHSSANGPAATDFFDSLLRYGPNSMHRPPLELAVRTRSQRPRSADLGPVRLMCSYQWLSCRAGSRTRKCAQIGFVSQKWARWSSVPFRLYTKQIPFLELGAQAPIGFVSQFGPWLIQRAPRLCVAVGRNAAHA